MLMISTHAQQHILPIREIEKHANYPEGMILPAKAGSHGVG
jgi:hypothetical protein